MQIPGTTWRFISGGGQSSINGFTLATKTDGTLWSWGRNYRGQLGQNNRTEYSSPIQIPGTTWSSISAGGVHSLATKTDGTLWAWGQNLHGQLAQTNTYSNWSSPVQIPGTTWSSISAGESHSLATKTDGTLWGWGSSGFGELGQDSSSPTKQNSPLQIPGVTWTSIDAGEYTSLGIIIR
ncbi:MAG: hypothetical protein EBT27_08500 [Betaproteobacteria bacterium]|nr:hypothetical protein [Betaproteobacteria bacterium]